MMNETFQTPIRILIDGALYRLTSSPDSRNILVWLDGHAESEEKYFGSHGVFEHIDSCCVFSHITDLLAFITLQRKGDRVCHSRKPQCYIVVKPSRNPFGIYETLRHYNELHGYLRHNAESCEMKRYFKDVFEGKFTDESYRYTHDGALVSYCMRQFRYIEI